MSKVYNIRKVTYIFITNSIDVWMFLKEISRKLFCPIKEKEMCDKCKHKRKHDESSGSRTETLTEVKCHKCRQKVVYKKKKCKSCYKKSKKSKHNYGGCQACRG